MFRYSVQQPKHSPIILVVDIPGLLANMANMANILKKPSVPPSSAPKLLRKHSLGQGLTSPRDVRL